MVHFYYHFYCPKCKTECPVDARGSKLVLKKLSGVGISEGQYEIVEAHGLHISQDDDLVTFLPRDLMQADEHTIQQRE